MVTRYIAKDTRLQSMKILDSLNCQEIFNKFICVCILSDIIQKILFIRYKQLGYYGI